jgi:hypothetical protein
MLTINSVQSFLFVWALQPLGDGNLLELVLLGPRFLLSFSNPSDRISELGNFSNSFILSFLSSNVLNFCAESLGACFRPFKFLALFLILKCFPNISGNSSKIFPSSSRLVPYSQNFSSVPQLVLKFFPSPLGFVSYSSFFLDRISEKSNFSNSFMLCFLSSNYFQTLQTLFLVSSLKISLKNFKVPKYTVRRILEKIWEWVTRCEKRGKIVKA